MEKQVEIKILKLNWLEGLEESQDLCVHGSIYVKIGEEKVMDLENGEWTMSSTGLYLMRSFFENYKIGEYGSQLIPCCGHSFFGGKNEESVYIVGCPNGIDWTIEHMEEGKIKHTTMNGVFGIINKSEYKKMILKIANEIEAFYKNSKEKEIPEDEHDKYGYLTFWKEWRRLKTKIENTE